MVPKFRVLPDIALIGIPWDGGTTNRAGARHGPREVRNQFSLMRRAHHVSGVAPFSITKVADVGDLSVNPINLMDGLARIEAGMKAIVAAGALPLSCGGDHLTVSVRRDCPAADRVGRIVSTLDSGHCGVLGGSADEAALDG